MVVLDPVLEDDLAPVLVPDPAAAVAAAAWPASWPASAASSAGLPSTALDLADPGSLLVVLATC